MLREKIPVLQGAKRIDREEQNTESPRVLPARRGRINLDWRLIMDTLSPHVLKDNPQTIYALADPAEQVTWADVFYIGMTVNPAQRYARHLSCSDKVNTEKNQHIQALLGQGKIPRMLELEVVATVPLARDREQYWIRYATAQGATLTNIAITYTESERIEAHQRRAVVYAKIADLLAQGIYVKRFGYRYPSRLLLPYAVKNPLRLLNARHCFITLPDGTRVNVEFATDEQFDTFIRAYIPVEDHGAEKWHLEERCQAINFACYHEILARE